VTPVFHGCGCGVPPVTLADLAAHNRQPPELDRAVRVIDLHAHVLCPEVEAIVADHPVWQRIVAAQPAAMGERSATYNVGMIAALTPRMTEASLRIADMQAMGIDLQVISPSPTQYHYWADEPLSTRLVALQNATILELCRANTGHFLGLAAVSLQFPDLAARQLEEAMRHPEIKGVEISASAGDLALADPRMDILWAAAERSQAVVFIHPLGTTLGTRVQDHYLSNVIGQPLETTIALSNLILSGLFDRRPGLKLLAAHGGGYLPAYAARTDHAWFVRSEAHNCVQAPSSYLPRLWFDTLVYDPQSLRALADRVGIDRLVLGTDYPFDMGAYTPWTLTADPIFNAYERAAMLGGNAANLLNLPM
jgi:aminocarboxymuconate-semialdehyde decarboxylase